MPAVSALVFMGPRQSRERRPCGWGLASQDRFSFLAADPWISATARKDDKGEQQHLPQVRLLPCLGAA